MKDKDKHTASFEKRFEHLRNSDSLIPGDDYFEELPGRIQHRIGKPGRSPLANWTFALRVSAAVAGIAIIAFFIFNRPGNHSTIPRQEIIQQALLDYPDMFNINEYMILEVMNEENDTASSKQQSQKNWQDIPEDSLRESITTDEIIDYLSEHEDIYL